MSVQNVDDDKYAKLEAEGRFKQFFVVMLTYKAKPEDGDFDDDGEYDGPGLSTGTQTYIARAKTPGKAQMTVLDYLDEVSGEHYSHKAFKTDQLDASELDQLVELAEHRGGFVNEAGILDFLATAKMNDICEIHAD